MESIKGDWSSLPGGLLGTVIDKLIPDHFVIGSVCSSWQSTYVEEMALKEKNHSSVFYLLLGMDNNGENRCLMNLSTSETLNSVVDVSPYRHCRGSCYGWLVTADKVVDDFEVELHDPLFSKRTIRLPPLSNITELDKDMAKPQLYIRKAVLSLNPTFARNKYIVLAIVSRLSRLIFWKPGIGEWNPIEWDKTQFQDVIYFHKKEQFYTVTESGEVFAIDMSGEQPQLVQVASSPKSSWASKRYLVESAGELLQVFKQVHGTGRKSDFLMQTMFSTFKLDFESGEWNQVDTLGGKTLFLGVNHSLATSGSEYIPNCIYFTDDFDFNCTHGRLYSPEEIGIFDLQDGTINSFLSDSLELQPDPIWIEAAHALS